MKRLLVIPKYNIQLRNFIEYECGIEFDESITIKHKSNFDNVVSIIKSFDEVFFVNFTEEYRKILPFIPFKTKCYSILTNEIGEYTNPEVLNIFNSVIEFYNRLIFKKIYTLSHDQAVVLKNSGYNVEQLLHSYNIKIQKNNTNHNNVIGIISNDYNPNNNFYNILTALTMTKVKRIKLISNMHATREFIQRFNLPVEFCENIYDVINNSTANILVNFTANDFTHLNESLKKNIPCLVGNFDENFIKHFDKNLVISSDDDVNEIASKINELLI